MKKIIFLLLLFLALEPLCKAQTGGFSLNKVRGVSGYEATCWNEEALHALNQPFHFMSSGAQSFVFVSGDGESVIKFFRLHRTRHLLRPLFWLLPPPLKKSVERTERKRKMRLEKDLKSYRLAEALLPIETGIIQLHLGKSKDALPLTLYDKIGVRHTINISAFDCLVQKRATPFYPTLEEWIQHGEIEKARSGLLSLCLLLQRRNELGYADKDPNLSTNFGFLGSQAIQFDAGRFREEEPRENEMVYITARLLSWLEERAPELAEELKNYL